MSQPFNGFRASTDPMNKPSSTLASSETSTQSASTYQPSPSISGTSGTMEAKPQGEAPPPTMRKPACEASGSGGYWKHRCKYWMSHDCDNWVWVNGVACVDCLARGRE